MEAKKEISNMISSQQESEWRNEAKGRQSNLEWRGKSFKIAVRILHELRLQKESKGMTLIEVPSVEKSLAWWLIPGGAVKPILPEETLPGCRV